MTDKFILTNFAFRNLKKDTPYIPITDKEELSRCSPYGEYVMLEGALQIDSDGISVHSKELLAETGHNIPPYSNDLYLTIDIKDFFLMFEVAKPMVIPTRETASDEINAFKPFFRETPTCSCLTKSWTCEDILQHTHCSIGIHEVLKYKPKHKILLRKTIELVLMKNLSSPYFK